MVYVYRPVLPVTGESNRAMTYGALLLATAAALTFVELTSRKKKDQDYGLFYPG